MTEPVRPPNDVDALARRLSRREPSAERSAAMRHAILDAAQASPDMPVRSRGHRWILGLAAAAAAAACAWHVLRTPDPTAATPAASAVAGIADATGTSDHPAPSITGIAHGTDTPGHSAPAVASIADTAGPPGRSAPSVRGLVANSGATSTSPPVHLAVDDWIARAAAEASERLPDGVTTFASTRPLQVTRGSATITAPPGARFEVEVRDNEVKHVTVTVGWVVVAGAHTTTTVVPAQYTWMP